MTTTTTPIGNALDAADLVIGDRFIVTRHVAGVEVEVPVRVLCAQEQCEDRFGQPMIRYWCVREDTGATGYMMYGRGRGPIPLEPAAPYALPDPGWGKHYGGGNSPSYMSGEGPVWMFRYRQRVRFYNAAGEQVGVEQANVAPAVAYALHLTWLPL